jgi:hypothetical protein
VHAFFIKVSYVSRLAGCVVVYDRWILLRDFEARVKENVYLVLSNIALLAVAAVAAGTKRTKRW